MGVRKAVTRVIREIDNGSDEIHVYGELIHNPQALSALSKKGMKTIGSIDEAAGRAVVIRTHGIPITEHRILKERSARLINLTCPRVARVQAIIKKYSGMGYHAIIAGDDGHAEIAGLKSYARAGHTVIGSPCDIPDLPPEGKYLLVSQTTFDCESFQKIAEELAARMNNLVVINTICESTGSRQGELVEYLKAGVDTLVVVGGKNSANTTRLADLGRQYGAKTILVESHDDLTASDFNRSEKVLVAAGASTPGWIINNILNRLYIIKTQNGIPALKLLQGFMEKLVRFNVLTSAAGYFITRIVLELGYSSTDRILPCITLFYIFSMYSIYNFMERDHLLFSHPHKYAFYRRYGGYLFISSLVLFLVSMILSLAYSFAVTFFLFVIYLFGFAYSMKGTRALVKRIGSRKLHYLYYSKAVNSMGWVTITIIFPLFAYSPSVLTLGLLSLAVFCLISIRSLLNDIVAYQGDMILGRGSIPMWAGTRVSIHLIIPLFIAGTAALALLACTTNNPGIAVFTINFIYYAICAIILRRRDYLIPIKYEIAIELNLVLFIILSNVIIQVD